MKPHASSQGYGTLYVVPTPIGNLGDMSPRAIEVLSSVDTIFAEDTRHFGKLKKSIAVDTPVLSYHEHNESARTKEALRMLQSGKSIALVSDAGTPCISDPGYRLLKATREGGIPARALPGPNAAITALSVSGFESDRFLFEGFPPQKSGKRKTFLKRALDAQTTVILYESPHRILKLLTTLQELAPERDLFIARELTKTFEEHLFGTAAELLEKLQGRSSIKGEIVLIIRREIETS